MSLITIIIPTYNSERTVRAALESVHSQTFQEWECVVVDGASKDDTITIVKEFCKIDNRFRYISEKDHGIYDAFNKGWKMAKSPWVHYLGSDDRLTKTGFKELFEQPLNADLIGGGVYLVRDGEKDKLQFTNGIGGCHQGFITKRTVIERLNGFDERYKIFADKDLLIRIEKAGYKVFNYRIPLAYFYIGGVSQSLKSLKTITIERYYSYKRNHYVNFPFIISLIIFIKYMLIHFKHFLMHKKYHRSWKNN